MAERLIRVMKPGLGWLQGLALSPDGTRIAAGGEYGLVMLTTEGVELWREDCEGEAVWCLDWSGDGRHLAVGGSWGASINIRLPDDGRVVHRLAGHPHGINDVSWSPDSDHILSASGNDGVWLRNARSGREIWRAEHDDRVHGVCWSPSGDRVASASRDRTVRIWHVAASGSLPVILTHTKVVMSVRWSPDGRHIASGSPDGIVRIWDAESHEQIQTFSTGDWLEALCWSRDSHYIALGTHGKLVHIWNCSAGRMHATFEGHTGTVRRVLFSPDGTRLASVSMDGTVRLWDTSDLMTRQPAASSVPAAASYAARQAATVGRRAGLSAGAAATPVSRLAAIPVPRLEGAAGDCLGVLRGPTHSASVGAIAIAIDGRAVFLGGADGSLSCLTLPEGVLSWQDRNAHSGPIHDMAISPDGRRLVTGSTDRVVRVWNAASGRLIRALEYLPNISGVCWSPGGERIVAVSRADDIVRVWDTAVWRHVSDINLHGAEGGWWQQGYSVSWSRARDVIAVGMSAGLVELWEVGTGQLLRACRHHDDHHLVFSVCWSPDGQRLASASSDKTICMWDPFADGVPIRLDGHRHPVECVAWSPDGLRLASASDDRTIRIWNTSTGAELARHEFPEEHVLRVAWSPDGSFLASSHDGNIFRLWDTRSPLRRPPSVALAGIIPRALAPLPGALAALQRLRRSAPLSLLRDLLALTGGEPVSGDAARLAAHPGARALASLRWRPAARVAFLLLLLREYNDPDFAPPPDLSPAALRWLLLDALGGPPCEPSPAPVPIAFLDRALASVDDRVLTLLEALGPEACAEDPALPLTLLARVPEIRALSAPDRRLLSLRAPSNATGRALARCGAGERAGFASTGSVLDLVPSEWALPEALRRYRAASGGLLYRTRAGQEPPRLPPMVLVLDASPTSFGPVEIALRSAAHAAASSLLSAGLPGYLVAAGGDNAVFALEHRADLVHALAARSREPAVAARALARARALSETLRGGPIEPVILLLAQPWFGAEEDDILAPPRLRGLFVPYPRHPATPALLHRCERSIVLGAGELHRLGDALADLLG